MINSEPGLIPVDKNDEKHLDDVGDADVLELLDEGQGGGLGATTKRNENCSFTRTRKTKRKKAVLVSV